MAPVVDLQDAYTNIFAEWYGDALSGDILDRRTLSTMSYLSFYELMKGGGKRKKYGRAINTETGEVYEHQEDHQLSLTMYYFV